MRLTTKGRYAVTAMLDLAIHGLVKPVSLNDISGRQGISLSYRLARDGSEISIAQVVDAVNESMDATRCQGKGDCQDGDQCLTHQLWCDLSDQIHAFLSNISIGDLVSRQEIRDVAKRQDDRARQHEINAESLISMTSTL